MLTFCPDCGGTLQICQGMNCLQFSCPCCPYVCPITRKVSSRIYPKLKDLDEVLGGPGAWESAQITNERCPQCHQDRAYFMELQTRSADEPSTVFYRCANKDSVFVLTWLLLLFGLFILIRKQVLSWYRDAHTAEVIALGCSSVLLFKVIHLLYTLYESEYKVKCPWWWVLLYGKCEKSSIIPFVIWRINALTVLFSIVEDAVVSLAHICGRSFGVAVASLVAQLPWIVFIPVVLMFSFIVSFSCVALFGYELNVSNVIKIRPWSNPVPKDLVVPRREILPEKMRHVPSVLSELYQKSQSLVRRR